MPGLRWSRWSRRGARFRRHFELTAFEVVHSACRHRTPPDELRQRGYHRRRPCPPLLRSARARAAPAICGARAGGAASAATPAFSEAPPVPPPFAEPPLLGPPPSCPRNPLRSARRPPPANTAPPVPRRGHLQRHCPTKALTSAASLATRPNGLQHDHLACSYRRRPRPFSPQSHSRGKSSTKNAAPAEAARAASCRRARSAAPPSE